MNQINVYDSNWNFVREFWAANGYGISAVGGYITVGKYFYKRMD